MVVPERNPAFGWTFNAGRPLGLVLTLLSLAVLVGGAAPGRAAFLQSHRPGERRSPPRKVLMVRSRPSRAPAASVPPEEILAPFPAEVRQLAERVRRIVRETIPTATEVAYPVWRGIGYRDPQCGYFCGIFPGREGVRLGFEHGVALPDPAGILGGAGKQVRYVSLEPGEEIPVEAVRELLEATVLHGAVR